MKDKAKPIPDGYHTITPYLIVKGATDALEFYKKAFGAKELRRFAKPDGKVGHAEVQLGNSILMLADEHPQMGAKSPLSMGGSPVTMHVYIENVDTFVKKATDNGAKVLRPLADQFYGDRTAVLADPFGHVWHVATHIEDLTDEEMRERAMKAMQ